MLTHSHVNSNERRKNLQLKDESIFEPEDQLAESWISRDQKTATLESKISPMIYLDQNFKTVVGHKVKPQKLQYFSVAEL